MSTDAASPPDPFDIPLKALRRRRSAKWTVAPRGSLPLWVAEMDVHLAAPVREALQEALDLSDTAYAGASSGFAAAFAGFAARAWGWRPDPVLMEAFPDLAASGTAALARFAGEDRRTVITTPVYNAFFAWLDEAGVRPVEVPLLRTAADGDGAPDLDGIERALADGVRTVLISSPHNPLGRLWRRTELERLAEMADAHGAVVIADEIHAPLTHPGHEFVPFLSVGDAARRCGIALHSASKGWNVAGLKASLVVRAEGGPVLPVPASARSGLGLLGAIAGEAAFAAGDAWIDDVRARLADRAAHARDRLAAELSAARAVVPEAGYLMWVDLADALPGDEDPAATILERTGLFVSAGHAFGELGRTYVRLNLGTSWIVLDEAIDRLVSACGR